MKRILVIEDQREERRKARNAVEAAGHYCFIAEDLHEAFMCLGYKKDLRELECIFFKKTIENIIEVPYDETMNRDWDGIITDLHFPILPGDRHTKLDPTGLEIAVVCYQAKIPCVICTDVGHHHTDWIKRIAKRLNAKVVDDKGVRNDAWKRAVRILF